MKLVKKFFLSQSSCRRSQHASRAATTAIRSLHTLVHKKIQCRMRIMPRILKKILTKRKALDKLNMFPPILMTRSDTLL